MTDLHLSGSDVGSTQIMDDLSQLGAGTQESEICNYEKMYVLQCVWHFEGDCIKRYLSAGCLCLVGCGGGGPSRGYTVRGTSGTTKWWLSKSLRYELSNAEPLASVVHSLMLLELCSLQYARLEANGEPNARASCQQEASLLKVCIVLSFSRVTPLVCVCQYTSDVKATEPMCDLVV